VKLSALHPRFEAISRERVLAELHAAPSRAARMAKAHDLQFTSMPRRRTGSNLSLEVIGAVLADPFAARLGRFRPCRAGLSEARAWR
jgi:RHH-type proline utilization regulon transcriptional repressor/proline dehydrogenase/delta 1-pyrroline-5-carboxylate dehydrogenase